jgi:chemotaxis protein methyltransferase CheR
MSSTDSSGQPVLTEDELRRFSEFLHARTGMWFGEAKRYYIERRLHDRLSMTRSLSFANYFTLLRSDPAEESAVINSFTVNETYFYREQHQLKCMTESILPEIVSGRGPGDKIRIWSQPCSTGEEAYSIAIWLLENWRMVDAYNVEIVGSDIDTNALKMAVAGRFGERALGKLPAHVRETYFTAAGPGRYDIIPDLRESVTFTMANLTDRDLMAAQGLFDIIFCRNVLIYFSDESRARAADHLYASLAPGGFICLGHTESMSRISPRFDMRRFADAIVFQRPAP